MLGKHKAMALHTMYDIEKAYKEAHMATVTGSLYYDGARSNATTGLTAIANVPIVLENAGTLMQLAVLTKTDGSYTFINVPNGNYRVVESAIQGGPYSTTGDFGAEAVQSDTPAVATTPPITVISNPPAGATNLDCITHNTINITVSGASVAVGRIANAPVRYSEMSIDPSVTVHSHYNYIDVADDGSFGTFPPGAAGMTGANPNPYPLVNPSFTYALPAADAAHPTDGEFTIQNIANNISYQVNGTWWRIADHSLGNEQGRMMLVNGANNGAVFFTDTVAVTPNTYYLFAAWILNLIKVSGKDDPKFGVKIIASDGTVLFDKDLEAEIPVNPHCPEWHEIGTLINSGQYASITVQFLSLGAKASGNDYAIDDVGLYLVDIDFPTPAKSASASDVPIGTVVDFRIAFENTTNSDMTSINFNDPLPDGLVFVPGSVRINGNAYPDADPAMGFALPDLAAGEMVTVTFQVNADHVPTGGTATNTASIAYNTSLVAGVAPLSFLVQSNPVTISITAETVTLTYDANGGTNPPNAVTANIGTAVIIASKEAMTYPTRRFINWNTEPDGSGITYMPGDTINLTASITLYAQWQIMPSPLPPPPHPSCDPCKLFNKTPFPLHLFNPPTKKRASN